MSSKTKSESGHLIDFARIEKFHPYKMFLFFGLLGSTIIFMSIAFMYLTGISKLQPLNNFNLPKPFFLSAVLLLFSSYAVSKTINAFKTDNANQLFRSLLITLVLGISVAVLQIYGWKKIVDSGFLFQTHMKVSYLYLISGIHFMHILLGLLLLADCTLSAYNNYRDPVKALVYFSNDYQLTKLELIVIFWHFVDFLWLGLFLIFLFTF